MSELNISDTTTSFQKLVECKYNNLHFQSNFNYSEAYTDKIIKNDIGYYYNNFTLKNPDCESEEEEESEKEKEEGEESEKEKEKEEGEESEKEKEKEEEEESEKEKEKEEEESEKEEEKEEEEESEKEVGEEEEESEKEEESKYCFIIMVNEQPIFSVNKRELARTKIRDMAYELLSGYTEYNTYLDQKSPDEIHGMGQYLYYIISYTRTLVRLSIHKVPILSKYIIS